MVGPLFKLQLRLAVRETMETEHQSLTRRQVRAKMDELSNKLIEKAVKLAGLTKEVEKLEEHAPLGAIGDGTLFEKIKAAIKAFIASDAGKALIKLLLSFLI